MIGVSFTLDFMMWDASSTQAAGLAKFALTKLRVPLGKGPIPCDSLGE